MCPVSRWASCAASRAAPGRRPGPLSSSRTSTSPRSTWSQWSCSHHARTPVTRSCRPVRPAPPRRRSPSRSHRSRTAGAEMAYPRAAVAVLLVVVALALQVTLLSRLPLPGATPDLVLLVVVGLALAEGPTVGLATGFGAGLAADLVPPADHEVGRWAFVLTLLGYLAGLAQAETRRSAFVPIAVVAATALGSVLLYAGLGALMDDPNVTWPA